MSLSLLKKNKKWQFLVGASLLVFFSLSGVASAKKMPVLSQGNTLFLTVRVKSKISKREVRVKGRVGIGGTVSISVNGVDEGLVALNAANKYSQKVPLSVGRNTIRVTAVRGEQTKIIEKTVTRRATKAIDKPLWVTILHSKNQVKKNNILIRGEAHGVWTVDLSVEGVYQTTVSVRTRVGKFKGRVNLPSLGANTVEATASKDGETVTVTKRILRLR